MSENLYVELSDRSKQIFKSVVETYLETGFPSGSETILKKEGFEPNCSSIYGKYNPRCINNNSILKNKKGEIDHLANQRSQRLNKKNIH